MRRRAAAVLVVLLALPAFAGDDDRRGTAAEAKELLERAVTFILESGLHEALDAFNKKNGQFTKNDLFVFCFGPDLKVTAHPTLIDSDVMKLEDADGKPLGKLMAEAAAMDDGRVEYRWKNAGTGTIEKKVAFVRRANSQVCSVSVFQQ